MAYLEVISWNFLRELKTTAEKPSRKAVLWIQVWTHHILSTKHKFCIPSLTFGIMQIVCWLIVFCSSGAGSGNSSYALYGAFLMHANYLLIRCGWLFSNLVCLEGLTVILSPWLWNICFTETYMAFLSNSKQRLQNVSDHNVLLSSRCKRYTENVVVSCVKWLLDILAKFLVHRTLLQ